MTELYSFDKFKGWRIAIQQDSTWVKARAIIATRQKCRRAWCATTSVAMTRAHYSQRQRLG